MSTTRHLVNRRRRLASADTARRTAPAPEQSPPHGRRPVRHRPAPPPQPSPPSRRSPHRDGLSLPAVLGVLTVLLGGFAAWAVGEAAALRDDPAVRNTALTEVARTSEVKGRVTKAVGELFSYDYASPGAADKAAKRHLTGKAVEQHRRMLAPVRDQGARQKLVLTTTVTESGVERLHGDRARVLVYADQSNTRTAAKKAGTTYGAAMFAVEAVRVDGSWRIAAIDTLGVTS
ncbi:hypothetical protein [Streptomyces sp. NPDC006368]|uniref:hypothetical protein n=1 Tax=Streptomyces sp. NPDC006368 TaxID=3156760 RepID=UPI0033B72770